MTTQKKVALITGANKGIGLETARQLGQQGWTVLLGARNKALGEAAAGKLRDERIDAVAVELDVTKPAQFAGVAKLIEEKYGHLDALVNNAGIGEWTMVPSAVTSEALHNVFETNFFAVVELTNALLPLVKKSAAGRIVNLSSILGSLAIHSDPSAPIYDFKTFAYNASKTALNAYTVHLAYELRNTNVKVNSAHPGWVKTELGGEGANMDIETGAKTSVALATAGKDGPNGSYIHLGNVLPW